MLARCVLRQIMPGLSCLSASYIAIIGLGVQLLKALNRTDENIRLR